MTIKIMAKLQLFFETAKNFFSTTLYPLIASNDFNFNAFLAGYIADNIPVIITSTIICTIILTLKMGYIIELYPKSSKSSPMKPLKSIPLSSVG